MRLSVEKANKWMSDGLTGYEIEKFDKNESGTEIKLFLNKVGKEYLKKEKIKEIIKKYQTIIN